VKQRAVRRDRETVKRKEERRKKENKKK
jgi:hypothetical protein